MAPPPPLSTSPTFTVAVTQVDGVDVVTASGDLDVFSSMQLRSLLFDPASVSGDRLVLDLLGVAFIDSTGLGVLIAAGRWTTTRAAEMVVVVEPRSAVARVLRVVGLDAVFTTAATRDEALARLAR